jgi:hypothetical protein
MPLVPEDDQSQLLASSPQGPVARVVGLEGLDGGMELDALESELLDLVQLTDGLVAFVGIDAAEALEDIRMLLDRPGHKLVWNPRAAGGGLGVPGQQQGDHVEPPVILRQLVEGAAGHPGAEVGLGRFHVAFHAHVQPFRRGKVDMEVDGAHRARS